MTSTATSTRTVEITHLARVALVIRAMLYLLTAALFGFGLYVGIGEVVAAEEIEWRAILGLLVGALLAWWALGHGILRLRTAVTGGMWIRVDGIGVHYRVAADSAIWLGLHPAAEGTVRWSEFQRTSYHRVTYTGITISRRIYLVHHDQRITDINLYPFKETIMGVLAAIDQARPST